MNPAETGEINRPSKLSPRHRGSASVNLSGWSVLTAWIVSVLFHVLVFVGMLILVFPFAARDQEPVKPASHIQLIGSLDATAFTDTPNPELPNAVPIPDPLAPRPKPENYTPLSDLRTSKKPDLSIIGIGAGGGDLDKYGIGLGGAAAPEFFGLGGSARGARTVVYVVDRSGSMLGTFGYVKEELKRSISKLRRNQKFHVIFFNHQTPIHNPPKKLVSAIAAQKKRAYSFMQGIVPDGGTKPETALRQALEMKPDLIYLLSDGQDFPPDLFRKLDRWNKDRHVHICTIAYVDAAGSELLELMAREHNGEFTYISEDDLP